MTAFVQRQLKTTSSDNYSRLRRASARRSRSALAGAPCPGRSRLLPGSPLCASDRCPPRHGSCIRNTRAGSRLNCGCPLVPVLALRLAFGHPLAAPLRAFAGPIGPTPSGTGIGRGSNSRAGTVPGKSALNLAFWPVFAFCLYFRRPPPVLIVRF